jgi:two-component system phosphate regulon sensor histidine kinase PhoR
MIYVLLAFLLATLFVLGWAIWQYTRLRRHLGAYIQALHSTPRDEISITDLPHDQKGLEDLSNAVKTLFVAQQAQTTAMDTEREKLATVLETMTDGVLIADADGRLQFANPAAGRLFECETATGRTVAEVVRHHQLIEAWQKCRQTGEAQDETIELPTRRQFLRLVVVPDRHTGGSLLLIQDLTHLRRLETVRRDFISNLSHELRTPLASLKALTETLQEGALDDPPAARRFLSRIETEVDVLSQMVAELLELSRIESGQVPLSLRKITPVKLIQSSSERMRAQAERAGLTLAVEYPASLPKVQADLPRLEQVLVNLIHNAIKFTRPGGKVRLSAEMEGDFVRFAVQDTGSGIPADDLPRIFERFYKTDRARSGSGTGLGLSISRHLVEEHGGRIWAESVEGKGSTFYFTIPTSQK